MKRLIPPRPLKSSFIGFTLLISALAVQAAQTEDSIGIAAEKYFTESFARLGNIAAQKPTVKTFRKIMKPCKEATPGFFGGTLIDTDYVIRQTYFKINALLGARGFDLKKVKQLKAFWKQMDEAPAPQLSEPGHSLTQPIHLIAMRYPIIIDGKLEGVVSMLVKTKEFLKASGLKECRAYKIICLGELAEDKGKLSDHYREVKLTLPSTEWVIQYDL